jgi:hypothetical protein
VSTMHAEETQMKNIWDLPRGERVVIAWDEHPVLWLDVAAHRQIGRPRPK